MSSKQLALPLTTLRVDSDLHEYFSIRPGRLLARHKEHAGVGYCLFPYSAKTAQAAICMQQPFPCSKDQLKFFTACSQQTCDSVHKLPWEQQQRLRAVGVQHWAKQPLDEVILIKI